MRGSHRLPTVAPHLGEDGGLRICINVPGLNRAASQECLRPSRVGRCEGPPHSYVRMPFGLPNVASAFQRNLRSILATQEPGITQSWRRWRRSSRNRLDPQSLPRLRAPAAREGRPLHRASSATSTPLLQWNQVTSSKFISAGSALRAASFPGRVGPSLRHVSLLLMSLAYLAGGAPRAASSPSRSGLTQWRVSSLPLPRPVCFPCLIYL